MRLREEYRKSGYFWLPGKQDQKIPGTLTITDGGEINLEVVGLFDESIEALNGDDDLSRIVGHVEKDGLITLEDCFYRQKNYAFGAIAKSFVKVNKVFSGVAYDENEKIKFHNVSFSVEGLSEWVGISGINVQYSNNFKTANISYMPQEEILYNLPDGFKLHICFGYTLPGSSTAAEAKITHNTYLKLSSQEARELPDFIQKIHQITYLLCFAVDATVTISNVTGTSNEITTDFSEGKNTPVKINIYYASRPFSIDIPKIENRRMLFRLPQIKSNAEEIFNNWLNAYSEIKPSIGLYFSATTGAHKYLDGKFLALAQGLETYHRRTSRETLMEISHFRSTVAKLLWTCPKESRKWLKSRLQHGNEINLGQRIKRIIEPYKFHIGNSKQRNSIVRSVVVTRNYLTHYSKDLEQESAKGVDLWILCQKLEAIFQLHLLQQIGFTELEIKDTFSNNYKLQQKFREI